MPNLLTPLDMLGSLIDPRGDEEALVDYKNRLSDVAESALDRDLTRGDDAWKAAREKELSGRLGADVTLVSGEDDDKLRQKAESNLLTYENVSERKNGFRWPRFQPQGEQPRFGKAPTPDSGVAEPGSLELQNDGILKASPGYVAVEEQLHYVPGSMKTASLRLPSGTTTTAIPPWHIESNHGHRIEVIDENTLRLIGGDGHEHKVNRDGEELSGPDDGLSVTVIDPSGPVFAQTRPYVPATGESRDTGAVLNAKDLVAARPNRPFPVPFLQSQTATTDPDNTDHSHTVEVSPHDFWSGTFPLPGADHNHRVKNWSVTANEGHTHTISKPSIPDERALVPRLVAYEGQRLKKQQESPYTLNMEMKDGWVVGSCPEGFSTMLVLGFASGDPLEVPPPETRNGTVGLGPSAEASQFYLETVRARVGADIVIRARLEDKYTGGIPHEQVTARWNLSASTPPSVDFYTDEDGIAIVRVPTSPNKTTYTVELSAGSVTRTETYELESLGEVGGYGIDYGLEYGS